MTEIQPKVISCLTKWSFVRSRPVPSRIVSSYLELISQNFSKTYLGPAENGMYAKGDLSSLLSTVNRIGSNVCVRKRLSIINILEASLLFCSITVNSLTKTFAMICRYRCKYKTSKDAFSALSIVNLVYFLLTVLLLGFLSFFCKF